MTIYIRLDMDGQFYVEHLVNASRMAKHELSANDTCALIENERKRSTNLVQQVYVEHLVNASQMAKHELSAAGVCRTLRECKPKTYRNFYQHLNTTKYTAFPVYNVLYDVIALCIQRDIA